MPTVLILFAIMLFVSAGIAGWLTWRATRQQAGADQISAGIAAAQPQATQAIDPSSSPPPASALAQHETAARKTFIEPTPNPATGADAQTADVKRFQLVCVSGALSGTAFSVGDECLISRGPVCWITVGDTTLSAPHLAIDLSGQPIRVKDLNSRNGVKLGGVRLGRNFVDLPANQSLDAGALTLRVEGNTLKVASTQRNSAPVEKSFAMPATFVVVSRREMPVVITGDIDPRISDAHTLMYVDNDTLMVKDLNSSNGTRVNQKRLTSQPMPAQPGDIVEIGQSAFKVVSSQ